MIIFNYTLIYKLFLSTYGWLFIFERVMNSFMMQIQTTH